MKIIRYSPTAFTPQKQTHHIQQFEYWMSLDQKDYPKHLQYSIQKLKKRKDTLL